MFNFLIVWLEIMNKLLFVLDNSQFLCHFKLEKLKERKRLEDQLVDVRVLLEWILKGCISMI